MAFVLYRYSELRLGNERDLSFADTHFGCAAGPCGNDADRGLHGGAVGRRPSYWQVLIVLVVLLTILDLFLLIRMEDPIVFVPTVFLDILRNVIWLLYFRRSRRVAVYFGKNNGFGMSGGARVCPRCGNPVSEDALFCGRCGSPLR